jgi:hypothetical protein
MSTSSKTEFDFQWANIPCELNDNTSDRNMIGQKKSIKLSGGG